MQNIKYQFLVMLFVLFASIGKGQVTPASMQDTAGELSVGNSGTPTYKVPIALPPGIKDVAPQVALVYGGASVQGTAGAGWSIVGISSISRESSRIDLDGQIDVVDFDDLDRFSLDGQRLMLKSDSPATYGKAGATYQTENYSNLKIESAGSFAYAGLTNPSGPLTFTVTFPDGTQAIYGNATTARGLSEWMITRWIDAQGNFIDYTYETENNAIRIKTITWGKNINKATNYQNKIDFVYKNRARSEYSYLNGIKIATTKILDYVEVFTSTSANVWERFRKYQLTYQTISGNYQRVQQIQEFNASNEATNPITFEYNNTEDGFSNFTYSQSETNTLINDVKTTGDFDGDGQVDFIANNNLYLNPIGNNNTWNAIGGAGTPNSTVSVTINNKLSQKQSIVDVTSTTSNAIFKIRTLNNNSFADSYIKEFPMDLSTSVSINNTTGSTLGIQCLSALYSNQHTETSTIRTVFGDFDGNGVSNAIIQRNKFDMRITNGPVYSSDPNITFDIRFCNWIYDKINQTTTYFMVDLAQESSTSNAYGNWSYCRLYDSAGAFSNGLTDIKQMDFNGDGKEDLIHLNYSNNTYKVFEIVRNFTGEVSYITQLIGEGSFPEGLKVNNDKKQLLYGDFNGDSKTDLMVPEAEDSPTWFMYLANGKGFERIPYYNFETYKPFHTEDGATVWGVYNFIPYRFKQDPFIEEVISRQM